MHKHFSLTIVIPTSREKKVIRALRKGKQRAFRSVFAEYHLKLYYFSKKMGLSHQDAECVVQDVFIAIWEQRLHLSPELDFKSYIYTITKRVTIKKLRRLILENNYLNISKCSKKGFHSETEDYIIFSNLMEQANVSIDKLPPDRKQIFMLSRSSGLSNKEIAEKLNLSVRTVENQLYRATKTLRKEINAEVLST